MPCFHYEYDCKDIFRHGHAHQTGDQNHGVAVHDRRVDSPPARAVRLECNDGGAMVPMWLSFIVIPVALVLAFMLMREAHT